MKAAAAIIWADTRLYRLSKGRISLVAIAGLPSLRLTTLGRKTGQPRSTNLLYYPHAADYVITGSNWGRERDPGWTFNLRRNPDATVEIKGKAVAVVARELTGAEHDRMWRELLRFWPGYAMERSAADRDLPIFLLSPKGQSPNG